MPSRFHRQLWHSAYEEYKEKGYDFGNEDALKLISKLKSLGWYPDIIMSNSEEIVIIEVIVTSDRSKPEMIKKLQPLFSKPIRLDKRRVKGKIIRVDEELWAWAQYRAKLLGYRSVSEYLFELIKLDKQKGILKKA